MFLGLKTRHKILTVLNPRLHFFCKVNHWINRDHTLSVNPQTLHPLQSVSIVCKRDLLNLIKWTAKQHSFILCGNLSVHNLTTSTFNGTYYIFGPQIIRENRISTLACNMHFSEKPVLLTEVYLNALALYSNFCVTNSSRFKIQWTWSISG